MSAPLWLSVLALRVRLGSPVLFRQKRPGRDEVISELIKFRTMTDARDAAGKLLPDAVRLTPFGRWLRATLLDELPELLNVLRGEMITASATAAGSVSTAVFRRPAAAPRGSAGFERVGADQRTQRAVLGGKIYVECLVCRQPERVAGPKDTVPDGLAVVTWHGISAPSDATMPEFMPRSTSYHHEQS